MADIRAWITNTVTKGLGLITGSEFTEGTENKRGIDTIVYAKTITGDVVPLRVDASGQLVLAADVVLSASDIEIGAVELKNATTDVRAKVDTDGNLMVNMGTALAYTKDSIAALDSSGNQLAREAGGNLADIKSQIGAAAASPTQYTTNERLKVLATALGEVQASPTQYSTNERLKVLSTLMGEVQASPTQYSLLERLKNIEGYTKRLKVVSKDITSTDLTINVYTFSPAVDGVAVKNDGTSDLTVTISTLLFTIKPGESRIIELAAAFTAVTFSALAVFRMNGLTRS